MRNKVKEMTTIKYDELKSQMLDIDPDPIIECSERMDLTTSVRGMKFIDC